MASMKKTEHIHIKISKEEKDAIIKLASDAGVGTSAFMRNVMAALAA